MTIITVDDLCEENVERTLCIGVCSDNKTTKAIILYTDVRAKHSWFEILVDAKYYGSFIEIGECVREYNLIE